MNRQFTIDGLTYNVESLSQEGQLLVERLRFAQLKIHMLRNRQALLNKAKNAYIADLKAELAGGEDAAGLARLLGDDYLLGND